MPVKVTIVLPAALQAAVGRLAKRLGATRNKVYVEALEAYVKGLADDEVTDRLNSVYRGVPSLVDPFLTAAARLAFERNP